MQQLILIDGMSGAGKTTTTKLLLEKLPRTAHVGMDVIKRLVSDFERGVRDNDIARAVTFAMAEKYLQLGLSVIVEQPFRTEKMVQEYEQLAKKHHINCHKYQIHADPKVAFERVVDRTKRNGGDLTKERAEKNISLFQSKKHLGFFMIDTTSTKPVKVATMILDQILK
ncbi:ATP-binding protein [Candidatus Nomurabacteria bacterium]|nr:ATP-binding protein [Candidatus Nomurabacteria bacterium]